MELFPAIDLRSGSVVRLTQGDYDQTEVYSTEPSEVAQSFATHGARNLHVVDLDGALNGTLSNFSTIRQIIVTSGLAVQVGGGIRDESRISRYLDVGVSRVILGTVAAENPSFVREMVSKYGDHIAVGVDARDGKVAVKGWQELTALDGLAFCKELEAMGVSTIIYTDIAKDGMMNGTNLELYKTLSAELSLNIIASGGVTYLHELSTLKEYGIYGAIVGKALYTGQITVKEALSICSQ